MLHRKWRSQEFLNCHGGSFLMIATHPHRIPSPWWHKLDHITSGSLSRKCQGEQNSVAKENLRVYFCWSPWSHLSTSFVGGNRSPQTPVFGEISKALRHLQEQYGGDRNLILMAVAMPMWEILDHAPHGPFLHRNLACPKRWVDNRIPLFFNLLGWSTLTLDRLDSTSWKESLLQAGRFPSQSKYFGLRLRIPKNRKPELSGRNVHTMPTTQDHFTWRESAKRKTHACQERHAQDSCASTRRTPTTRWGKRGWGVWERNEDDSRDWNKWHESGGEMLQFDYNIFEMGWFNHQLGHEWFPVH